MFISKNYLNTVVNINQDKVCNDFKLTMQDFFNRIFEDKEMFSNNNFSFYYYDEYTLNTPTFLSPFATLYIEINQPNNYKPVISAKNKSKASKQENIVPELYLTLKEIKSALFETSVANMYDNVLIWQDKLSVNYAINEYDENNNKITYYFKVIPCLTYKNENNINGVLYYDDAGSWAQIEYPKLSILNFKNKSKQTNGIFSDYVVMFKNFFMMQKKEKELPSEIFETLLYNVPNDCFEDYSVKNIYNVINFMKNYSIKDYKSLDEQDYAFTSKYKSFSLLYGAHAIKQLEKFIKLNVK